MILPRCLVLARIATRDPLETRGLRLWAAWAKGDPNRLNNPKPPAKDMAHAAGVSVSRMSHALASHDPLTQQSEAVLAQACGVSANWLRDGRVDCPPWFLQWQEAANLGRDLLVGIEIYNALVKPGERLPEPPPGNVPQWLSVFDKYSRTGSPFALAFARAIAENGLDNLTYLMRVSWPFHMLSSEDRVFRLTLTEPEMNAVLFNLSRIPTNVRTKEEESLVSKVSLALGHDPTR
jgi:hypothetical protein